MRNFQTLDQATISAETGLIELNTSETASSMWMRQEGSYIAISASAGPLEIALRLHLAELTRAFARLHPVDGLQITRQVGSGQAYLGVGLLSSGELLLRPTIIADATGHLSLNLTLTSAVRQTLFDWLAITKV
ncbi:MAG: hypothetical protein H7175_13505 [Burkholderiales bacterium]|nr:hypothetical protein [Anaerolineae bacterium]